MLIALQQVLADTVDTGSGAVSVLVIILLVLLILCAVAFLVRR